MDSELAAAVQAMVDQRLAARRKTGTVLSISGTKVVVSVDGGSPLLPRYAHYTPTVGDTVQVDALMTGAWIVTGKTA